MFFAKKKESQKRSKEVGEPEKEKDGQNATSSAHSQVSISIPDLKLVAYFLLLEVASPLQPLTLSDPLCQ